MAALQIVSLLAVAVVGCLADSCFSTSKKMRYFCYGQTHCCFDTCCYYGGYNNHTITGTTAAIVLGSFFSLGLFIGSVWLCYRRHVRERRILERSLLNNQAPLAVAEHSTYFPTPAPDSSTWTPTQLLASPFPVMPGQNPAFFDNQDPEYQAGQAEGQHTAQQQVSGHQTTPFSPDPPSPWQQ